MLDCILNELEMWNTTRAPSFKPRSIYVEVVIVKLFYPFLRSIFTHFLISKKIQKFLKLIEIDNSF
ncbi:hypothetical protein BpHYR1_040512 [Brachionus plicatilis]|uniref:Uncharacterized protein n=1 Tax=Brachionus plicatilis TaxID=10195 RepID=A0A3M7T115_BRAPC|nr:hypothetical protein BpHYR1_040512 [Brachionus plicatilis]